MDNNFILNLFTGSLRDPILWIMAIVLASNIISKTFKTKLFYLSITGIVWGYLRLYVYRSFGEDFSFNESIILLFICLLLMVLIGSIIFFIFNLFKSNT